MRGRKISFPGLRLDLWLKPRRRLRGGVRSQEKAQCCSLMGIRLGVERGRLARMCLSSGKAGVVCPMLHSFSQAGDGGPIGVRQFIAALRVRLLAKSGSLLPGDRQGSAAAWAKIRIPDFPGGKPPCATGRTAPESGDESPHSKTPCGRAFRPSGVRQFIAALRGRATGQIGQLAARG
jgi:hypothetical protein